MVIARWRAASAPWKKHVVVVPGIGDKPAKALLQLGDLMEAPPDDVARASTEIVTDPVDLASPETLLRMADDPAVAAFANLAVELADAAGALAPVLDQQDIDNTQALELERSLRKSPKAARVADMALVEAIDLQVTRLELRRRSAIRHGDVSAREAFHRATMAVYADLGALINIIKREPDLRVALFALDSIAEHTAPERGDTPLIAHLKHGVGHLLESLNTVADVRKNHPRVGSAFWRGRGIDRTWGAIASGSYHEVAIGAAEAVLETDEAGAAQTGRRPPLGVASGVFRRKVIEAATDAESWARLAENLEHEYRSALLLLLPLSPTGEPRPAAGSSEEALLKRSEEGNFADVMERYSRSCDEMRTVRLNPRKAIPVDQWPEETQFRAGVVVRGQDWKKYSRYVLRVAVENERLAGQARLWWAWWEKTQTEPSKAGPAPLVSPGIEPALRIAAARRGAESPIVTRATADGTTSELEREHAAPLDRTTTGSPASPTQQAPPPADPRPPDSPPRSAAKERWAPSAHQQLVITLLKRDGRLRTGTLWARVSPKHIDLRAHQNAMRDLVDHDAVRTIGKGRAVEYWVP